MRGDRPALPAVMNQHSVLENGLRPRGQSQVDRRGCVVALFEVNPVSEHDGAVEREARFRTVPSDEFANSVVVGSLTMRFGAFFLRDFDLDIGDGLLHRRRQLHRAQLRCFRGDAPESVHLSQCRRRRGQKHLKTR